MPAALGFCVFETSIGRCAVAWSQDALLGVQLPLANEEAMRQFMQRRFPSAPELGDAGAARAVGQALGHNPFAPVVPCHRVLAARNASGGFSAEGGVATKLRMLQIEKAQLGAEPGLFDDAR